MKEVIKKANNDYIKNVKNMNKKKDEEYSKIQEKLDKALEHMI